MRLNYILDLTHSRTPTLRPPLHLDLLHLSFRPFRPPRALFGPIGMSLNSFINYTNCQLTAERLLGVNRQHILNTYVPVVNPEKKQCKEVVSKASNILGMIKRNFSGRTKNNLALISLVRPHLEY